MDRFLPVAVLFGAGAAWGLTLPLLRISVSTGNQPLGLILWQSVISAVILLGVVWLSGRRLPFGARYLGLFTMIACFGAVLPGYFTFLTAETLPAGVRSIVLAIVPMFVLPMALLIGTERLDMRRLLGIGLGAAAIVLMARPGAGVTGALGFGVLLLSLVSPFSYAVEANYLDWRGSRGLDPFQLLLGASVVAAVICWPLAEATGQLPRMEAGWGAAEWALLGSGILNTLAYVGYVWLVGRSGSVFASQISYLVTGFGVIWSMVLLDERYGPSVWVALLLMLIGVAIVQPRGEKKK